MGALAKRSSETVRNHRNAVRDGQESASWVDPGTRSPDRPACAWLFRVGMPGQGTGEEKAPRNRAKFDAFVNEAILAYRRAALAQRGRPPRDYPRPGPIACPRFRRRRHHRCSARGGRRWDPVRLRDSMSCQKSPMPSSPPADAPLSLGIDISGTCPERDPFPLSEPLWLTILQQSVTPEDVNAYDLHHASNSTSCRPNMRKRPAAGN
jgi:hypothetical protein